MTPRHQCTQYQALKITADAETAVICILESMKMQVSIKAHKDGIIKTLKIKQGASVAKNDVLVEIE